MIENPSKKSCRLLSSSFAQNVLLGRCFPVNFVKFEHLQGTVPYSDNIYAAHQIIPWYDIKRELRMLIAGIIPDIEEISVFS